MLENFKLSLIVFSCLPDIQIKRDKKEILLEIQAIKASFPKKWNWLRGGLWLPYSVRRKIGKFFIAMMQLRQKVKSVVFQEGKFST